METKGGTSSLRILVLAPKTSTVSTPQPSPFPAFLQRLTGEAPSKDITSFSGYTSQAPIRLKTRYYEKQVNIWCDELPANKSSSDEATTSHHNSDTTAKHQGEENLAEWQNQMTSPEAREVRDAIGAIVLLLPYTTAHSKPDTNSPRAQWASYIETQSILRDLIEDETGREVAGLIVLVDVQRRPSSSEIGSSTASQTALLEDLETECLSQRGILGWDFISIGLDAEDARPEAVGEQRNEYGEQVGFARVLEVLQGVDWSASTGNETDDELLDLDTATDMSFLDDLNLASLGRDAFPEGAAGHDARLHDGEVNEEMMELKMAMLDVSNRSGENETSQDDEEFGALAAAQLPRESGGGNDDVWASLDNRDTSQDEAIQVDRLQGLMERVVSIREAGSEMSRSEREKFAKREISRLMKEL